MKLILCFIIVFFSGDLFAQEKKALAPATNTGFDHNYKNYDDFLKKHVVISGNQSNVRYEAVKADPKQLMAFIKIIENLNEKDFKTWSEQQRLAFLINAYNALTIKIIIDNYPVESIKDIGSLFKKTWSIKFFTLFGKKRWLDYIEHDVIRVEYKEPRIHFALVCASKGCPPLRNEAFVADKLDEQLAATTKNFLTDTERNRYLAKEKKLELSSIFKWYGKDFRKDKRYGSVEAFVAEYLAPDAAAKELIRRKKVDVDFLDYDWKLNLAK